MDIIETKYHKTPAIILLVDFSKEFNSIKQDYIFKKLSFFNFGTHFIDIVKTRLKDHECTVMIDGFETRSFKPKRSATRPWGTAYLFILVLEILLICIKLDNKR